MRTLATLVVWTALSGCGDDGPPAEPTDAGAGTDADPGPDAGAASTLGEVVTTTLGSLRGAREAEVLVFRGVPYAEPPVDDLRWRAPVAPGAWDGERDATENGPVCPQLESWGEEPPDCGSCADAECGRWCQSEDCLSLNLWTPASGAGDGLPVMVWLHGGSFIYGSGSAFDGAPLAASGDVVVVTVNYRLGPLSVLGHPELDAEASSCSGCGAANYGLWDQIAALEWVRDHVASFGGDPARVTVFGESAGGSSVCQLLTSPLADGLVAGAIMQSGLCAYTMRPHHDRPPACPSLVGARCPTRAELDAGLWGCASMDCLGRRLGEALGCDAAPDELACMRAAPARDVLSALPQSQGFDAGGVVWARFVDGVTLTSAPGWALERGEGARVPFVLGTAADEASLFFLGRGPTIDTVAEYDSELAIFGACADELRAAYPAATDDEARDAYLQLIGDQWYGCPTRLSARAARAHGQDTFLYEWRYVPWAGRQDLDARGFRLGAYHSAELPYVFGTLTSPQTDPTCVPDAAGDFHCCDGLGRCFEAPDVELSAALTGYWSSFARDGAPTSAGHPDWPRYESADDRHLWLDLPPTPGTGLRAAACAVWEGVWSHLLAGGSYCD